ncbi:MAG TPA: DUF4390 domain-containing protein, partial [Nitrosospira sp.]
MPCCTKPDSLARLLRAATAMLLAATVLLTSSAHAEGGIRVKSVTLEAVDDGYQFDADFEIMLNP